MSAKIKIVCSFFFRSFCHSAGGVRNFIAKLLVSEDDNMSFGTIARIAYTFALSPYRVHHIFFLSVRLRFPSHVDN